jgi:Tc toxin complex TcA C-terminal TcB-binding domain/Neuraminidase-like domain/Putative peptidoglycan binding domain
MKLPILNLLSFWAPIDTASYYVDHSAAGQPKVPSLYDKLFRNKAVSDTLDPAFPENANNLSGTLSGHATTISNAFGISAEDFQLLFGSSKVIPDDTLSLDNLSSLYRHSILAKALKMPIRDYLSMLELIATSTSPDPFATTADTVLFVEIVDKVKACGYSISELDYLLLHHNFTTSFAIAPSEEVIAVILDEIRTGLQRIAAENTFNEDSETDLNGARTSDPDGTLTRQKLALLNWDSALIDQVVATLNGAVIYEAVLDPSVPLPPELMPPEDKLPNDPGIYEVDLAALPAGFSFPSEIGTSITYDSTAKKLRASRFLTAGERVLLRAASSDVTYTAAIEALFTLQDDPGLKGKIWYDQDNHTLKFAGIMTHKRWNRLKDASHDVQYREAIDALFDAPRIFLSRYMRTFSVQNFYTRLDALSVDVEFPKKLKSNVYFDAASEPKQLHFIGPMTENERDMLLGLSSDQNYTDAVNDLFDQAETKPIEVGDAFLTASGPNPDTSSMFDDPKTPEERFLLVLKKLLPYLRQSLSERLIKQKIAENLNLEYRVAEELLTRYIESRANPGNKSITEFLAKSFAESNLNVKLTASTFPDQFNTFILLHKIASIITKFEISNKQLVWIFEYGPSVGWLDLNTLPIDSTDPPASFDGWHRLLDLFRLRDGLPAGELILDEIFNLARTAGTAGILDRIIERLSEHVRWDLTDLEFLVEGPQGFNFAANTPAAFQDERALSRLFDCFSLMRGLKMSAQQCRALAEADVTQDVAKGVRKSVRARYEEEQWLSLAKLLRDILREKQLTALVEYLVAHLKIPFTILESPHPVLAQAGSSSPAVEGPAVKELQQKLNAAGCEPPLKADGIFGEETHSAVVSFQQANGILPVDGKVGPQTWALLDTVRHSLSDKNDLYRYFLIDVEMNPCMVTSRIKQALSSVQLFVQRCFMNLEENVAANTAVQHCLMNLDEEDMAANTAVDERWREWKWMKNYRVWEANRKVFLYPENWIEPELRDDKSPFFKELEGQLLQGDLTDEMAENALVNYLAKLDQVARLEIIGMYHQKEVDCYGNLVTDVFHVFGRTLGIPHIYYYRQLVDSAHWTPWEKVDLDIEGDHLIPVVWNRRLYLFWPTFMEKERPSASNTSESEKYYEVKIAWSERQQNKWSVKKLSSTFIEFSKPLSLPRGPPIRFEPASFVLRSRIDEYNNLYIILLFPYARLIAGKKSSKIIGIFYLQKAFRFNGCNNDPEKEVDDLSWQFTESLTGTRFPLGAFLHESDSSPLYLPAPYDRLALALTPGKFYLLPPHDGSKLNHHASFYMDNSRTFLLSPREVSSNSEGYWWETDEIDPSLVLDIPTKYYAEVKPFQLSPISAPPTIIGDPQDPAMFEPSFAITPSNNNEEDSFRLLPAVDERTTRATNSVFFVDSAAHSSDRDNDDTGASAVPSMMETTHAFSDSIRLIMHPQDNNNNNNSVVGDSSDLLGVYTKKNLYRFQTFYHPYVCALISELNRNGVDGLLQRRIQIEPQSFLPQLSSSSSSSGQQASLPLDFRKEYEPHTVPTPIIEEPYPVEDMDFEYSKAYALYNWELFFHVPLMIADRLGKNQRFEEAQKWFHRIFDPTDTSSLPIPQRYWRTKPFYNTTQEDYQKQRIQNLLKLLAVGGDPVKRAQLSSQELAELQEFENSVDEWRKNPFKPHLIAQMRTTAYQKTVVMKYIDNLIAWGDQLFRRETIESINEAMQLYIMAAEILGHRPEEVPPRAVPIVQTYNTLEPMLDRFSNALVQIEEFISPSVGADSSSSSSSYAGDQAPQVTLPTMLYFCVPKNDKLLGYWDTIADRLFKIRHCMNIQGTVRELPLFELPIDPSLLVRAAAAGIDISSVLNDINPALPHYRFNLLAQKASELCSELKSLGAALLAALEKKDAEKLALIRAEHETSLLKLIELVKEQQHDEAVQNQVALRKSRDLSIAKYMYYQKLLGVQEPIIPAEGENIPEHPYSSYANIEDRPVKRIQHEIDEHDNLVTSQLFQQIASYGELLGSILHLIPDFTGGFIFGEATFGGSFMGRSIQAWSQYFRILSADHSFAATIASKTAQYVLRAHEWTLQSNLAAKEIMHIDKQIAAAEIRKEIAKQELTNHVKQIQNARQVEDFMRSKFTNEELYTWMIGQISTIYFQSYQLAYDVAKRAETAYRFELGLSDSNFIQFGYWDSLKRGLLAGERLYHAIKRMEVAYLEQNQREYEITKHISLSRLDPLALAELKQTGECFVSVPEALFDLDYPGHYLRRIKYASLTVPCVTGPYVGVNCTLTLLRSSIRHSNSLGSPPRYRRQQEEEDPRFRDSNGAIQSIVTSSGQNDSGLFETNLRDERYLPFEGAGAISEWHIQLPRDFRQFDYNTISDVVLHLRYTAREGGEPLRNQAVTELQDALNEFLRTEGQKGLALPISLRHEFPSEWHRFLNPPQDSVGDPTLTMNLGPERFPFMFQGRPITINEIELFVKVRPDTASKNTNESTLKLSLEAGTNASANALTLSPWNGLLRATKSPAGELGDWTLIGWLEPVAGAPHERIDPNAIEDILVVCHYSL